MQTPTTNLMQDSRESRGAGYYYRGKPITDHDADILYSVLRYSNLDPANLVYFGDDEPELTDYLKEWDEKNRIQTKSKHAACFLSSQPYLAAA
ncbi:hypothetical protein FACS1894103_5710 [Campylobacterota bacterium]|nr:hypothetical protein FACS1894103_5710 [Campylobacterota bacterium]